MRILYENECDSCLESFPTLFSRDHTCCSCPGILLTAIQHPTNIRLAKAASAGGTTSSAPSLNTQRTGDGGQGNGGQGAMPMSALDHSLLDLDHEAQAQIVRDIMASGGVSGCCYTVVVRVLT